MLASLNLIKQSRSSSQNTGVKNTKVADRQMGIQRCPYCHDGYTAAEQQASVVCQSCLARHHEECWEGQCASCGSTAKMSLENDISRPNLTQQTSLASTHERLEPQKVDNGQFALLVMTYSCLSLLVAGLAISWIPETTWPGFKVRELGMPIAKYSAWGFILGVALSSGLNVVYSVIDPDLRMRTRVERIGLGLLGPLTLGFSNILCYGRASR